MKHSRRTLPPVTGLVLALGIAAAPADAAVFQFNTLIRLGANGNSAADWEFGAANNTTVTSGTSLSNYWSNGVSREFRVTYTAPSNNLEIRVYNNGSATNFVSRSFTPAGGPAPAGAIWRLPAASFFVTARPPSNSSGSNNQFNAITVSNLSLTGPSGGALGIIQPLSATSMQAQSGMVNGNPLPLQTVTQSRDITFRGDSNGSWRLAGFVTMNFSGIPGNAGRNDRLLFGVSALTDTPEPATLALVGAGCLVLAVRRRRLAF